MALLYLFSSCFALHDDEVAKLLLGEARQTLSVGFMVSQLFSRRVRNERLARGVLNQVIA
jgi:hypothetical protein